MTIEPISSMMTVQAQGSVAQRPQASVAAERPEEVSGNVQTVEKVDRTTNVVESAQEKGQSTNNEQAKDQQTANDQIRKDQQATNEQIRKAVEQLNKSMANSEAVFGIHEETNRITIKIVDKSTKEVLKELPPEKTLDMIARVWDMAGILIDEKR